MAMLGILVLLCSSLVANSQHLTLDIKDDGNFSVLYNGQPWLNGGEYMAGGYSSSDKELVQVGTPTQGTGADVYGDYVSTTLKWAHAQLQSKVLMETSFRTYPADTSMMVFEQFFPNELLKVDNVKNYTARTLFPGFYRNSPASAKDGLDCYSYHLIMSKIEGCKVSTYKESHQGGAPLTIYDSTNVSLPMVVFSPLSNPKAQHMSSSRHIFGAGIKSTVEIIPNGWSQLFLLSAGLGINQGMMDWGDRMLKYTGKPRADMYRDATHSTIGFWTDNGGYYHYETGSNKTYEEVLPEVKAHHEKLGVPFGHWQFDSWFYPKDGRVAPGGGGGAVVNWTSMDSVFPSGMAAIQEKLQVPMVMHNRQWSTESDYIKNLPFEWYTSELAAVPKDPLAFFSYFFTQQQGWGLSMYEQDWMYKEYDEVEALQTNITLADQWLSGMASGAALNGLTIQYCMAYPHDILAASAFPAVTNARASDDYFHSAHQWAVGASSLFYWALGILPFKDGFYSSNLPQVGGQTVGPETDPDREALMATLSCSMVGPMDGIGLLNVSRTMSTCRHDGVVLRPDRPLTTTDSCFRDANPGCFIYHTYSDMDLCTPSSCKQGRVHYHYNDEGEAMSAEMVYLEGSEEYVVYNWYSRDISHLKELNPLVAGYEGHAYAIVVPIVGDWAFVGEVNKYVTLASIRFPSGITSNSDGSLSVAVMGIKGETVEVCASHAPDWLMYASDWLMVCEHVSFDKNDTITVDFSK